ncbi:MAG: phosphoribosylformylglycinamidine synthase [Acidimicrobiia bacterium]
MRANVCVTVRLRPEIPDPQGKTIEESLPALGFHGVTGVRVGKSITFTIEGQDKEYVENAVKKMCEEFLANPVIEDFSYEISNMAEKQSSGSHSAP